MLIFPRHVHHFTGNRCTEHHHLRVGRRAVENFPNITDKSHFQHFVRFVEHSGIDISQPHRAASHMIEQAPRRRHHNVRLLFQHRQLSGNRLSAINRSDAHIRPVRRKLTQLFCDLYAKFPRGTDDHRLNILGVGR